MYYPMKIPVSSHFFRSFVFCIILLDILLHLKTTSILKRWYCYSYYILLEAITNLLFGIPPHSSKILLQSLVLTCESKIHQRNSEPKVYFYTILYILIIVQKLMKKYWIATMPFSLINCSKWAWSNSGWEHNFTCFYFPIIAWIPLSTWSLQNKQVFLVQTARHGIHVLRFY